MKKIALILFALSAVAYLAFGEDRRTSTVYYPEQADEIEAIRTWEIRVEQLEDKIKRLEARIVALEPDNVTVFYVVDEEPQKPYLHKNPNNGPWICSKHGCLPQYYGKIILTRPGMTYCSKCFWETTTHVLGLYITGVKKG